MTRRIETFSQKPKFLKKQKKQLSAKENDTKAKWTKPKIKPEQPLAKPEAKTKDTNPFPTRSRTNTTKHKHTLNR